MKLPIMSSLFFVAGLAHAGAGVTVQSLPFQGVNDRGVKLDDGGINTPYVTLADRKVAAKINDHLFIALYNVMAPRNVGKTLGAADGVVIEGTVGQDFKVARNDGRILAIALEGEGCGAYCESYRAFYHFDVKTGRMLDADDLFTEKGLAALQEKMRRERRAQYRKQLLSLRKELKAVDKKRDAKSEEAKADLLERIALNSNCAGEGGGEEGEEAQAPSGDHKFELGATAITLLAERCSNHAMRALDDVGEVRLALPYKALAPHLTSYGKTLLLGEGSATHGGVYGQLLRGKLGAGTAITMLIDKTPDNEVVGMVFYDKYGKPINVTGKQKGSALVLSEVDAEGVKKGEWRLVLSGERLKGRWIGSKAYDVELAP
ncbi:hypothetical protein [Massilia glaciei]|uniref:Uncharacterized protein n=1 Tax=Massilia glaciei TaxID=1524097 RepID=A0A2U2I6Z8_9BURK|nr:hypothetical protein [Massilia glaciei]PWF55517.1 hypothetical protein C7C56_001495 [Massilia glaciei]